jgi:hypothetical protein
MAKGGLMAGRPEALALLSSVISPLHVVRTLFKEERRTVSCTSKRK